MAEEKEEECIPCTCKNCFDDLPEGITEEEMAEWFIDEVDLNLDDFDDGELD